MKWDIRADNTPARTPREGNKEDMIGIEDRKAMLTSHFCMTQRYSHFLPTHLLIISIIMDNTIIL